MSDGLSQLDGKIARFEELIEEMREATSEANSAAKQLRDAKREIETLLTTDVRKLVNTRVSEVIKTELDKIGPEMRKQSSLIYKRVGDQIDKLIDICMGKEFAVNHLRADLRPQLAMKLRIWIREVIDEEFPT